MSGPIEFRKALVPMPELAKAHNYEDIVSCPVLRNEKGDHTLFVSASRYAVVLTSHPEFVAKLAPDDPPAHRCKIRNHVLTPEQAMLLAQALIAAVGEMGAITKEPRI